MKFFLDSAKADEIRYARDMWNIDGVTSNPRHVRNSGKPFLTAIRDIAREFEGTGKPISVEVNPHHLTAEAMVEEAVKLASMSPNFVIKLPATEAGYRALWTLSERGIRVNLTLVFSAMQALQAARLGATFVSPFVGWKEANGEEISHLVQEIVTIYRNYHFKTEVLVAAVRNARQIVEAAVAGAHIVTAGFDVFKEAFDNPYTAMGLKRFSDSWDATPYE
ncbi:MAG: transaldolase [Syntrophaceae bacterium]|nr:transaldolase [Syntrophaceae bacterium]